MTRLKRAWLGEFCAALSVAACASTAYAAADETPGLPLQPTRTISFETNQGTWLSADVSPDGRVIVFDMLGDLYRIPVAGGEAERVTTGMAFDSQPAFSPDGQSIAFLSDRSGAENVWVMDIDGSDARQVTDNVGPNEFVSPAWSFDGTAVFVSLYRADRNAIELWQYDLESGARQQLEKKPPGPDRGREQQEQKPPADLRGREQPGEKPPRTDRGREQRGPRHLGEPRGFNALGAAPSPDGRYVYYAKRDGPVAKDDVVLPLWSVDRRDLATGRTETLVTDPGSAMRPVLSPDGAQLAYAVRKDGKTGLRLRDLESGDDRMLAYPIQHDAQESLPTRDLVPGYAFTPDGKTIVLTRNGGFVRIEVATGATQDIPFVAKVELELGPQLRQLLKEETGPVRARLIQEPQQSPDGRQLAFSALGRIYVMDLVTGAVPRLLTRDGPPSYHPAWSVDGRLIAYVSWTAPQGGAIWIADATTGAARRITQHASFYSDVRFTPEGTALMALRSSAHDRRQTVQEPMWTGRSGGFLRHAELVEITLADGATRVITSGLMGGAPQFTHDRSVVYLNTAAGLEQIQRDGSDRSVAMRLVGLAYYFLEGPAPASDIKLSPDGRHALVIHAQQLYLVDAAKPDARKPGRDDDKPIDLSVPDARVHRLTYVGADFSGWSEDGNSITWAVGSTYYRRPLSSVVQAAPQRPAGSPASEAIETFQARVEVPRDTPAGSWVLRGATVITMRGDEVIANADILVRDNRIAALGARGQVDVPPAAHIIDAAGQYVIPGLIDAHVHFGGIRREVLELDDWGTRAALAYGVTATLDPSSLSIDMLAYEDSIDAGLTLGPRLYTTCTAMFSFNHLASLDEARDLLLRYRDHYRTRNVKQYRIGSRLTRQWIAIASRELGMMPTTEGALDMKLALTHVLDGYAGSEHSFGVFPLYRDVVQLMARAQTSYVLTLLISHGGPPAAADFITRTGALTDPVLAQRFPPAMRERSFARVPWVAPRDHVYGPMAADAAAIQRAGGIIGMGSHGNFPGLGMHWEMQAHAAGGMSPHAVLQAATMGSAVAIGRGAELGSLEAGKLADFVILSANPLADIANTLSIRRVVKDGRVYEAPALDETWPRQRKATPLWFQTAD